MRSASAMKHFPQFSINILKWKEIKNCPGSYRKEGMVSHGYQLNYEYLNYTNIGRCDLKIFCIKIYKKIKI